MLNNIFLGTNEKCFLTIRKWGLLLSNVLLWFLLNRPGVMCVDHWPAECPIDFSIKEMQRYPKGEINIINV